MISARPLDIEQLVRVPAVVDFAVSPDGRTVAIVSNRTEQFEIGLLRLDSDEPPHQITDGAVRQSKVTPVWSRDGARLAFAQDYEGDERYDIFVYDLASGASRTLTPDTPEYLFARAAWSPDGARIAVTATRGDRFGVWTLPVEGGEWSRVSNHAHSDDEPHWSPRGDWIAFVANTEGQHYALFLARPDGSEQREVRMPDGGPLFVQSPEWSPDGARIAFVGGPRDVVDVGVYDVDSGALRWIEQGEHECATPAWSPDGRQLVYTLNVDGSTRPIVADLASGGRRDLTNRPGLYERPQFADGGRRVLYIYSGPGNPPDLWECDLRGPAPAHRQLTSSLPGDLADYPFVAPTHVRYLSADGETSVPALFYAPRVAVSGGGRPAVIQIHGGPSWQRMNTWYPEIQWLLSRGCAVLCPNYRGSTGYGRAFMEANRFRMGEVDLQDVAGGVDWLLAGGHAEAGRVAVTGWSFGGYLTMMCLTHYPDRFAAGAAGVPFLNWILAAEEERDDLRHWDRENMGDPATNAERLRNASPIHFMDRIQAPVQFIGGANDPRCPISQVHEAQAVMEKLDKPFEAVIYSDEGHGFLKLENEVDAERRWAEFLALHLEL